jgi:hypothetical protein
MKIIKCYEILNSEIGFQLETGEIYYVFKDTLKLKNADCFRLNKDYRILRYKLCKNPIGSRRILIGHIDGCHDWVVLGFMESFIQHKNYFLKGLYLEEVKNDR